MNIYLSLLIVITIFVLITNIFLFNMLVEFSEPKSKDRLFALLFFLFSNGLLASHLIAGLKVSGVI